MSHTHPQAIPAANATAATVLVPVDVDAAVDAATMLTALHERVERQFAAYEAAEDGLTGQFRAVRAIGTALATHVALEDELLYPAVRAHASHHDRDIEQQLEQDNLLDLLMVELGGMVPTDPATTRRYGCSCKPSANTPGTLRRCWCPSCAVDSTRPNASCSGAACSSGSASSKADPDQASE